MAAKQNYMAAWAAFGKSETVSHLPLTTIYALAAPSNAQSKSQVTAGQLSKGPVRESAREEAGRIMPSTNLRLFVQDRDDRARPDRIGKAWRRYGVAVTAWFDLSLVTRTAIDFSPCQAMTILATGREGFPTSQLAFVVTTTQAVNVALVLLSLRAMTEEGSSN